MRNRDARRLQRLEPAIRARMAAAGIPGLSIAVVQRDRVLFAAGFGTTSVGPEGVPVTAATLFRIASLTKPLTGLAAMRLVEAGVLDLDAAVAEYLPGLRLSDPNAAGRVTLRLLLSHTSGLAKGAASAPGRSDHAALASFIRDELPHLPFIALPGRVPSYSNAGFSLLGHVVETAAAAPFAEAVRALVTRPLGMAATTFTPAVSSGVPFAMGHPRRQDGGALAPAVYRDNTAYAPAGGAIANVLDLTKLAMVHLGEGAVGGRRILAARTVAEMQRLQTSFYTVPGAGYGLALEMGRRHGARRWIGHTGLLPGYSSHWWLLPEHQIGVVLLCNAEANEPLADLCLLILDELLGPIPATDRALPPIAPDRALWPAAVGTYVNPAGETATVAARGDGLTLDWVGRRRVAGPLQAVGRTHYCVVDANGGATAHVGFIEETCAPVQYILVNSLWLERVDPSGAGSPTQLPNYLDDGAP